MLQGWIVPFLSKIQSAHVVVRERDLLFRLTQKDARFDRELVDALTELDLSISNRRDLRLIDLEVMATPPAADEMHNSIPLLFTDDHKVRNRLLKTTNRYQQLWRMYRPLWEASLVARYLRAGEQSPTFEAFSQYLSRADIEGRILGHYLKQLEKSAGALIADANFLE